MLFCQVVSGGGLRSGSLDADWEVEVVCGWSGVLSKQAGWSTGTAEDSKEPPSLGLWAGHGPAGTP